MKALVKSINAITISFFLVIIYFIGVGLGYLILTLTRLFEKKNTDSYWITSKNIKPTKESYYSPY